MTSAPSRSAPSVLRMAAPLVVSFWMRAAVTMVDTVYASFLGDAAVAAVGLTIPLEFLMIAMWVGLSTGLTSALSRAMGARQGERIAQYLRASWRLVAALTPLFTVVGAAVWFVAPKLGLEPETAAALSVYGTVLIGGSAFTTFWSIIPDSLVKAHQDTRSTMWAGIATNVINVSLNTLFLFAFHWGVLGIALSTVLGRIGGLVYALGRAASHERRRKASGETPGTELDPRPYRAILSLALPASITFSLVALESAGINALLARLAHPTEAIAAYSIYYRVMLFCLQPVIATGVAMLPFAARRIGAGDVEGVRAGLRQTRLAVALYSVVLVAPIVLPLAPHLAASLAESEVTRRYTEFALRMVPLGCLGGAMFLLCRPVFEAMGRAWPGLVMAGLRYLVLTLPLGWGGMWLFARLGLEPLHGLIVGLLATAAVSSLVFELWVARALAGRLARARDAVDEAPVARERDAREVEL
jgi:MATE family, multidrug efflux pump